MSSHPRHVPSPAGDKTVVKVVLVGDIAVGKTSLRKRLVSETFSANYLATLGVDFATKKLNIDDQIVELQIWDIAGQPNYHTVADRFLTNSDAALLVYDVTSDESFIHLEKRMNKILELNEEDEPAFIVVGNKIDLQEPERTPQEIDQYFKERGLSFNHPIQSVSTSAKTGANVEEAFRMLAKKVLEEKIGAQT